MDTLELTREDIVNNEQITISDLSNPLTVDDGDYFHVYIGISATSLCEVDLEITDGFIGGYGSISLERLTRQTNMYALHFSLDSYLYDYQEPQYRNSEFFITAYTCGELSEEAEFSISQKGCEHTCTITWKNENTILETDTAQVGTSPSYDGPTPTKQNPQSGYTYEFAGWSPIPSTVTGDTVYQAQFTAIPITFTVTWKMDDGSVLTAQTYNLGATPAYPGGIPEKQQDEQYTYQFTGWTPSISPVTADTVYTAQFSATTRIYIITWLMDSGTLINRTNVAYGVVPTHSNPSKPSDAQYDYTFSAWTPNVVAVTGNATYTAQFSRELINYNIYWDDGDGTTLQENEDVHYGDQIAYTAETPTKEQTVEYTYTFDGWDPDDGSGTPYTISVTGDTTYTAQFEEHTRIYTVSFDTNGHGDPISPQSVPYDGLATRPSEPVDDEYTFLNWYSDPGFNESWNFDDNNVQGDVTLYAKWEYSCRVIKCIVEPNETLHNTDDLEYFNFGDGVNFSSVEEIKEQDFSEVNIVCDKCITALGNNEENVLQDDDLVEIILPETLTILHDSDSPDKGIFSYGGIRKANLSNITKIGAWTFEGCEFYAILPNTSSEIDYYNNLGGCAIVSSALTEIGESAFGSNENLRKVELPSGVTTLYRTFHDCHSLTSVTIPNSVTSIGEEAFSDCSGLTSVTIPNSVTSIGMEAFNGCSGLTSVTIPNSVTSIGRYAFEECTSLTTVAIPNSVTSIGSGAFVNVPNIEYYGSATGSPWGAKCVNGYVDGYLVYENSSKSTLIVCSTAAVGSITLPNTVTNINDEAFFGCTGLTSVTIPNSVTSIEDRTFYGCSGLTSVTIPNSVTSIGDDAFSNCSSLTSVTIPNSVTSIGYVAFAYCSGLTSVTIPNSVTSIGDNAFYKVPNIEYYGSATGSPWGAKCVNGYVDGYLVYENSSKSTLIVCSTAAVGSITLPNTVTNINDEAFFGCTGLTSVTIPNSVTSIEDRTFYGCSGLTSVTIPNSVTSIGEGAFEDCSSLTSVTIPNSVTSIGNYAFYHCYGLTSATIGNSITSIGTRVFGYCTGLESVTIGNNVTSIASDAFYKCSSLTSVTINSDALMSKAYSTSSNIQNIFGSQVTNYVIGNSVASVGGYAFYGCIGLTSVIIGNSVTSIGDYAFYGCSRLASVTIPNSVTSIGENAFYDCGSLAYVTIPNSVTSIGSKAFMGCSNLTSVTIPNSVTSIGSCAFKGCDGLASVTIGNSVTSIGDEAFSSCSNLTSVTIPNSVTAINYSAFAYCSRLAEITLPYSIANIGNYVFYHCNELTTVTCKSENPPTITNVAFDNNTLTNGVLHVPSGLASTYRSRGWGFNTIREDA